MCESRATPRRGSASYRWGLACLLVAAGFSRAEEPRAKTAAVAVPELDPMSVVAGALIVPGLDAPGVIQLTEQTLEDRDIINIRESIALIPNVSFIEGDGIRAANFTVRGAREITFNELTGGRAGVAFYIDDIPVTDVYGRDLKMFSVERVDLFKGPHGSSFGAPGPMGVFEVKTRAPGPDLEGGVSYAYGSDRFHRGTLQAGGAVTPELFLALEGLYSESEGWYTDSLTGDPYGRHETIAGRLRLRWVPSDRFEMTFTAGGEHHDDDPAVYVPFDASDPYTLAADPEAYADGGQNYQAVRAVWQGEGWRLKSITARRESAFDDSDNELLREVFQLFSLQRQRDQEVTTWSQEIRAESTDEDAPWRWRTGLFFSHQDSFLEHTIRGTGPREGYDLIGYSYEDWAAYGEVTRKFGERLELGAGLRLQITRNHTDASFTPTPFAESLGSSYSEIDRHDYFRGALPMASATWKWSAAQRSYFRFSTGLQPGGLANAGTQTRDYASERTRQYELGHESAFLDGAAGLRAGLFYTDYRDYQSFQFYPGGQAIFNAARAHAWGGEIQASARPIEGLELFAGAGYTQARFDEYESRIGDFSGYRIGKIPRATANLGASYRAGWGGMARVDGRYTGDVWFDEGNTIHQSPYWVFDARIGYERGRFGAYLIGRNLLDEEYFTHAYLFQGLPAATPGMPRTIGAEIRATF